MFFLSMSPWFARVHVIRFVDLTPVRIHVVVNNESVLSTLYNLIYYLVIVYGKLELKPVNSIRNRNGRLINSIINILVVYVVIDNVEDITGLNATLVITVLCTHCIIIVNCLLTNIATQMLNLI